MVEVSLVPHQKIYAKSMSALISAPQVKDALGLINYQSSLNGTIDFIEFIYFRTRKFRTAVFKSYSK